MKKIVITGAIGYIGMELCKIYSGKSLNNKIVAIDKSFSPSQLKLLNNWNIEYKQIDILDLENLKTELHDANIVYHLAGITDVPTTNNENKNYDIKLIEDTAVIGTRNVLSAISDNTKLVFPSSHVIFEGLRKVNKSVSEETKPVPILEYSKSKLVNENDIKKSKSDYVILRLGSVYGYSGNSTRINIMPNLFAKNTAMNKDIKLYSGGRQLKSLVSVFDVARCLEFTGENPEIKNQIFNCVNENTTVEGVAKFCKKANPNIELIKTNDSVPNLGYWLNNKKIKSTGFKFLYNLENSIQEMYDSWSFSETSIFNEQVIQGSNPYIDSRGVIENFYFSEEINMIGTVTSKKGSVRGNHYHPIQTQQCLLMKGSYVSITKDLTDPLSVVETRLIKEGELSIIPPNVAHTMIFLKDSTLLNLVSGERDHENYGLTHTYKYDLVNQDLSDFIVKNYKTNCRACGSEDLDFILSLGLSPLANNLLSKKTENFDKFPLDIFKCKTQECFNVQLSVVVPPDLMFKDYLYVSSTTESFRKHFFSFAKKIKKDLKLNKNSLVVDIGSNDGVFLKPLKDLKIKAIGVDPAENLAKIANNNKLKTFPSYFDNKIVNKIMKQYGKADLVTAFNVFAHSDNLKEIAVNTSNILKKNGVFVFEVQYFLDTIRDLTFDNIYHEHTNYWTLTSIMKFFNQLPLKVYKVEKINTHGGSIRVYCSNNPSVKTSPSVNQALNFEKKFGILDDKTYSDFSIRVKNNKKQSIKNIKKLLENNIRIIGYGAPAKATTVLNYFGINSDIVEFTIEDNKLKHNKFIPGTKIKIVDKNIIENDSNTKVLVMAWNYFDVIVEHNLDKFKKTQFIPLKN